MKRIKQCVLAILAVVILAYAMLQLFSFQSFPVAFGASFSQSYAQSLGLDWRAAYTAMLSDLNPRLIRIAAEWNRVEATKGTYTFDDLDWMMDEAKTHGARALFVVGQKVPRWPECYIPDWFDQKSPQAKAQFFAYVETVVRRYRGHPALAAWQVENEPFIHFPFGECEKFERAWVLEEIARVVFLDPVKPIVVTDSGELGLWLGAARRGDVLGTTVYRFVATPRGMEWSYAWLPAAWYRFRARMLGKGYEQFIISELQAEPWESLPFSPERFRDHIEFVRHTGASEAYLWGMEWWYFMKTVKGDQRYWEIAKDVYTGK